MPTVHCKKCNNKPFESLSDLRVHQWKEHKEFYSRSGNKKAKAWTEEQRKKYKATMKARKNGHISVEQLLERLRKQRSFMDDVVSLVESIARSKA